MSKKKSSEQNYPAYLATRDIFFTNLLLLGFEPGAMESKYNIPFTKDMFTLPNKKAFEVVTHFLFSKLNPVMAADKFRVCWPIADKKQEQVFRRTIVNWLLDISKEDPDAHLPRIVPSLFLSPGGGKFYTVLLYFTQFVIDKAIRGENGEKEREILRKPQLAPGVAPLSGAIVKTYQAATIRRQKRALEQTQVTLLVHRQWQQFASELVKDYRALSKAVRELDRKVKDLYAKSYDLAQARGEAVASRRRSGVRSDGEKEVLAVKRAQKLQKVRELWKVVDNLMVSQAPEREVVESILQEVAMKSKLDAEDIHVQVPELLLRECEAEIQRRNIANVYQGGKLSLLSLIQLWNLALQLYLEKIHQAPLASFDTIAPSVISQVHTHHAHLSNAQALRSSLSKEVVPQLKASIGRLKKQNSLRRTPGRSQGSLRTFHSSLELMSASADSSSRSIITSLVADDARWYLAKDLLQLETLGLGLLPATPPVSFDPAHDSDSTPVRLRPPTVKEPQIALDTPEAVSRMSQAVDKAALKTSGLVQGTLSSMLGDLRQQIHGLSKLPMPTDNTTSLPSRKRAKSAPSKVASTPPEPLHSRLRPRPGQSHRKQVTKLSRTRTKQHHKVSQPGEKERQVKDKMNRAESDRRIDEVAAARQINNNASRTAQKERMKSTSKAHQILVDQIADAVMSGDGDTFSPQLPSSSSQDSPPIAESLKNPLAALDESAFVSRDKLKRTPTQSSSIYATGTPLQQATRILFNSKSERKQPQALLGLSTPQGQAKLAGRTEGDVWLRATPDPSGLKPHQGANIPISNLMDLSNTSLFHQDTAFSEDNSDDSLQSKDAAHPTRQEGDDSTPSLSKSHQNDLQLLHRTDHTPPDLPLEDLEQTLLEITRTKTPQLPFRSRQRISQQNVTSPIEEDPEDDLISSTRLSLSLLMNMGNSPAHTESNHTPSLLDKVTRTDYSIELDDIPQTRTYDSVASELHKLDSSARNQNGTPGKNRQVSGGSQKSVTFSDHIDEHSFQDFGSPAAGYQEEIEDDLKDYVNLEVIDADSSHAQGSDFITSDNPKSNVIHTESKRDNSTQEKDNAFLSETYLRSSPPSKLGEDSRQSLLDSALQSELDLSGVLSPDPSKRMQLLEHISPMLTPSKTPKLEPRKGAITQGHLRSSSAFGGQTSQEHIHSGSPFNGIDLSSGYIGTPMSLGGDVSLVKGLSDLRLSGSLRHSGKTDATETVQKMVHHTPTATLEFGGIFEEGDSILLDENDSILLSDSSLSKSLHDDGPLAVTSPPVQNLIDI